MPATPAYFIPRTFEDLGGEIVGPIIVRNGTHASIAAVVPSAGEIVFSSDTHKLVGGNGVDTFSSLVPLGMRYIDEGWTLGDVIPGYAGQICWVGDWAGISMSTGLGMGNWGMPDFIDALNATPYVSWVNRVLFDAYGFQALVWSGDAVQVNNLATGGYVNGAARHQELTGPAVMWNLGTGASAILNIEENSTFDLTNIIAGRTGVLAIIQVGPGGSTITWPAKMKWPGGVVPTLSTAVGAVDMLSIYCPSPLVVYATLTKDIK